MQLGRWWWFSGPTTAVAVEVVYNVLDRLSEGPPDEQRL